MVRWVRAAYIERSIKEDMMNIMKALGGVIKEVGLSVKYATVQLAYTILLHLMIKVPVIVAACSRRGESSE